MTASNIPIPQLQDIPNRSFPSQQNPALPIARHVNSNTRNRQLIRFFSETRLRDQDINLSKNNTQWELEMPTAGLISPNSSLSTPPLSPFKSPPLPWKKPQTWEAEIGVFFSFLLSISHRASGDYTLWVPRFPPTLRLSGQCPVLQASKVSANTMENSLSRGPLPWMPSPSLTLAS